MSVPVFDRPVESTIESFTTLPPPAAPDRSDAFPRSARPADAISRMIPPQSDGMPPEIGGLNGLLGQLFAMLQQLLGNAGGGFGGEPYFPNANGGSVGDPHLSFNGSSWDNMGSQPDLIDSDSFFGGYQVSTQATPPDANGVTYNASATVTTNFGATQVSLDKGGNATISQNGYSYPLQPGQSMDLGDGELATRNADGSLQVTCNNSQGGQITTTMRCNGNGVDVTTSANNVDLGGTLVAGQTPPHTLEPMQAHALKRIYAAPAP